MRLRHPPGRSGRLWLQRRLGAARRGADLLDHKRQALLTEERRLRGEAAEAEVGWRDAAAEAAVWLARAAVVAGDGKLGLVGGQQRPAEVHVRLASLMGVTFPAGVSVELGPPPGPAWGGSAAVDLAVAAHRRALEAAARQAAARAAVERVAGERLLTARRQRAVERRWMPALTAAETALSLALEEAEREDAIRRRWVQRRRDMRSGAVASSRSVGADPTRKEPGRPGAGWRV